MASKTDIKVVIFDFDGTLVDLKVDWKKVKADIKKKFQQFEINEEFTPLNNKIKKSLEALNTKKGKGITTKVKNNINKILDMEEIESLKNSLSINHAREILEYLDKKNIYVIIATQNGKEVVEKAFNQFNFPKPKFIFSRNDKYIKPDKKLLGDILSKTRISKTHYLLVGDTLVDEEFGRTGEIKTLIKHKNYTDLLQIKEYLYA